MPCAHSVPAAQREGAAPAAHHCPAGQATGAVVRPAGQATPTLHEILAVPAAQYDPPGHDPGIGVVVWPAAQSVPALQTVCATPAVRNIYEKRKKD